MARCGGQPHLWPWLLVINGYFLVGGLEHLFFSMIYGMSSFPLTFIFFKMVKTTNQFHVDDYMGLWMV